MKNKIPKILVVDDTEATRYAVARTLKSVGYEIIEAANGMDALKLVATELPDLVTLDIHLPDILGFEVCRRIKMNPVTAHIPVLQVSASYVTSKDRIHGLEGGADSYLTHPFEPPVLIATVKSLLRGKDIVEELRRSEDRFRVALKNAPIMIYTCDLNLQYTWVHNLPEGLTAEDFLGKKDADVFSAEDAKTLTELKKTVLETGVGLRVLKDLKLKDHPYSFDITIEPLQGSGLNLVGLTVSCIDVTERVRAERAQQKATEFAELANQAKSRFLSNMSHEIRTPLGVIQGFADLALDPVTTEEERSEYLGRIKRNAMELTKLIGEILDLSKIEAGHNEIELFRFSLKNMLGEIVSAMEIQSNVKGVGLKLKLADGFPNYVMTDGTRTRQILLNVISNAIKFTPKGQVEITGRCEEVTASGKSTISIDITDTGIGLSKEDQKRLFQAFSQADSSTTRRFGGTGLGLDLSKRLAQSIGGDLILLNSEPGVGSTFRFTFDAGKLNSEDYNQASVSEDDSFTTYDSERFHDILKGLKILLVDDSKDNQLLFSEYIRPTGASVRVASDGQEGVDIASSDTFDVILMDVQMPLMDGYQATAKLRDMDIHTPVVAITAHAMKEEKDRAESMGLDGYLIKPLNPVQLIRTLEKYRSLAKPT